MSVIWQTGIICAQMPKLLTCYKTMLFLYIYTTGMCHNLFLGIRAKINKTFYRTVFFIFMNSTYNIN